MVKKKRKRRESVEKEPYVPRHINELWAKDLDEFTDSDWRNVLRLTIKLRRLSRGE